MQVEELFSETPDNEKLSPTVDAYDELVKAYDFYNQRLFNGDLPGVSSRSSGTSVSLASSRVSGSATGAVSRSMRSR